MLAFRRTLNRKVTLTRNSPKGGPVPPSFLRLSICVVLAATLAGCGGGGSSSTGPTGPTGPTGNPTTVTYTFDPSGALPAVVATQIGNGAYTKATLASNILTFTVPNGETRYSVAYLCTESDAGESFETINQTTISDATTFTGYCDGTPTIPAVTGAATIQVDASAIPDAGWILVSSDGRPSSGSLLNTTETLDAGTYDLPVVVYPVTTDFFTPLAVRILRKQTIPGALNGGSPIVFQSSDELVPQTATYSNLPSGYSAAAPIVNFTSSGGATIGLDASGPAMQYMAMPSASVQAGDYYQFTVQAEDATLTGNVTVETYTSTGGEQSFTFPATWPYAGPTAAALPTIDYTTYTAFAGMPYISMNSDLLWYVGSLAQGYSYNAIRLLTTANFQNGSTSVPFPDLSAVTGFLTPPPSGASVQWGATIWHGDPFLTTPPSGTTQSVSTSGTYLVP
jgi:hypothetical protein